MGAANSPSPAPVAVQDAAAGNSATTTACASATGNDSAMDASSQQPQQPLFSPASANANSSTGKRKRSGSPSPSASTTSTQHPSPTKKKPDDSKKSAGDSTMITVVEDRASRRLLFMEATMRDLLTLLKSHDPTPSILRHPIPNSMPSPSGAPPIKRTKISPSSPNTLAEKLLRVTYTSLTTLLSDISAVCRELLTSADNERSNGIPTNGTSSIGSCSGLPFVAQVIHFEELAKQVITRERVRRADLFDFVEEASGDSVTTKPVGSRGKVALTVMGQHGPLFSSLQNPVNALPTGDSVPSSRSTSASASPKSSISTVPTSTATSPKAELLNERPVYTPLNESHLPPLISTVKAIPSNGQILRGGKRLPSKEGAKVSTLGEAFPAPRGLPPLLPPKPGQPSTVGLKWGGKIGVGGIRLENPLNDRPEGCGDWLSYKNNLPSNHPLARHEPPRSRAPLPADLVAAYSSFAPSRDDSGSKIPAAVRNRVWWDRAGKQIFAEEFADDFSLHQMHSRSDEKAAVVEAQTEEMDLDEEFRKVIDDWEPDKEIPIDTRLLNGIEGAEAIVDGKKKAGEEGRADVDTAGTEGDPEKILSEISNLLQSLRSQQYTRLSALPVGQPSKPGTGNAPVLGTPLAPDEEEIGLYNIIRDRLIRLISKLPPHLVTTIDGDRSSDLTLSSKLPVLGGPIFKGTLPADESHPPKLSTPQVQGAAMAAMNAAAGLSPVNSAPVAHMSPARSQHHHHHHTPNTSRPMSTLPNISVDAQYHGHQMPHYHGHTIPSVTTPHHYPSPYAPAPSPIPTPTPQGQYQPPPPRIVSPLNHRQPAPQQQFHGHSLPAQTYQNPPPAYQAQPHSRRTGVPPPQGLAAVGVGYSSPTYNNAGLRMGVQHTQQSMGPGAMSGGRYAGRRR
ncbi:unnamed protein product [Tuber melanosporum]|uniref:(Perigord truffle) hypothetical protein n=1 Tax=Tuber melanosporum (strain Mel28) TaxID=656061 RepID=D5GGM9_TUBMM|nr:uncharacterized protein GSTUM_00007430001 [Tuber melanosporum]CAZ83651.1 unnamed protein product [Tuber melanosporum]